MKCIALVQWPYAPLTNSLVLNALNNLHLNEDSLEFVSDPECQPGERVVQWSTYDAISHELTLLKPDSVISSSYTIRKALIRKHFLHRCIHSYTTKYPESILASSVPRTWDMEISFSDELDDLWTDELYDLADELDNNTTGKWWILKPGMADRGMGIRLFNSKASLQSILESFEGNSDDEDESIDDAEDGGTNVVISQLRHFVIQEYLQNPVLMDPNQVPVDSAIPLPSERGGHKFHLRAYCVASGNLTVYLYDRVLALFSSVPFKNPSENMGTPDEIDLAPHLTNTCLQQHRGEQGVRLLQELVGCTIVSEDADATTLAAEDADDILQQISDILADTFRAAVQSPVHFQPLPNAFELFGVDFLVTHKLSSEPTAKTESAAHRKDRFQISILEVNSEPAIEMTGPRLRWILEDLFVSIARVVVLPFLETPQKAAKDDVRNPHPQAENLRKCLSIGLGR